MINLMFNRFKYGYIYMRGDYNKIIFTDKLRCIVFIRKLNC